MYVGGIVGMFKSENAEKRYLLRSAAITDRLRGKEKRDHPGTVLYRRNRRILQNSTDTVEALQIKSACISSPQYMNDSMDDILGDKEN